MHEDNISQENNAIKISGDPESPIIIEAIRPHSNVSHYFDTGIADIYGPECALLVSHFTYWIDYNRKLKRNLHEGRTWMYQTRKEMAAHFSYWSEDEIKRLIEKLVDADIIIKGNFNKSAIDKTCWYAFKNEKMFTKGEIAPSTGEIAPSTGEIAPSIPHILPHSLPKESLSTLSNGSTVLTAQDACRVCVFFLVSKIKDYDPKFKLSPSKQQKWEQEFLAIHKDDGRDWNEIQQLIENSQEDQFWRSRAHTPQLIRKHATKLMLTAKVKSKEEKHQDQEEQLNRLIEKNKEYAKPIFTKYKQITDRETHLEIKMKSGVYIPLGYADNEFKEKLDVLVTKLIS